MNLHGPNEVGAKEAGPRLVKAGTHVRKLRDGTLPRSKHLVPSALGTVIHDMFRLGAPDLLASTLRAKMESDLSQLALGQVGLDDVIQNTVESFKNQFTLFEQSFDRVGGGKMCRARSFFGGRF